MGRRQTDTTDYFPHFTKHGRTLFILESKWGNDGYAFWFKLLEILGNSEGHFLDCRIQDNWDYLVAYCRMPSSDAISIVEKLAELGNLHEKLWRESRIIWCENFVENLKPLYSNRKRAIPTMPSGITTSTGGITTVETTAEKDNYGSNTSPASVSTSKSTARADSIVEQSIGKKRLGEVLPETAIANRPIYHLIESAFISQAPQVGDVVEFNYSREGPHIKELEGKALAREGPEEFAKTVIVVFWQLIHSSDQFWKKQPFLPSVLNSGGIWPRVLKEMENHREEQLDDKLQEIIGGLKF